MFWNDVADTLDKSCWIKLCTNDLIGAICQDSDTPIADKGYQLSVLGRLDLRAQMFCVTDSCLTFNVDQYKIVRPRPEHGQSLSVAEGGIYIEARDTKDLITKRTQHLAAADVQNRLLIACKWFHDC
jgi:hypothetical protein